MTAEPCIMLNYVSVRILCCAPGISAAAHTTDKLSGEKRAIYVETFFANDAQGEEVDRGSPELIIISRTCSSRCMFL